MPALQCPDACLVSVTMHNGTAVGYTSPSTFEKFASTVGGTFLGGAAAVDQGL